VTRLDEPRAESEAVCPTSVRFRAEKLPNPSKRSDKRAPPTMYPRSGT
jgi:hypothetical protein